MPHLRRGGFAALAGVAAVLTSGVVAHTRQPQYPKQLTLPNPYRLVEGWPTLPKSMNGGRWGELIRVNLDPQDNIWVFHRCFSTQPEGAATCVGHPEPPILQFDRAGKLLTSFGGGMFAFPHGFTVDDEGNIWACDLNADETVLGLSSKATDGPFKGQPRGLQCFKFSPSGKVLMTLGKAGVRGNGPDTFNGPQAISVAANGDIFVVDDGNGNSRIMKFSKDGTFIKSWGRHNAKPCDATLPSGVSVQDCKGAGPDEFDQPHDMAFDSSGRVFIADRGNNRLQIFDQEGNFIAAWSQFGRPSAIFISKDDTLYTSDSHSNKFLNPNYTRGITVGSAKDGSLKYFIPDPDLDMADETRISGASGIVADAAGTIYAADVGSHDLRKYVKVK